MARSSLSPDLSEVERSSRLKHLVSLMYFPQLYEWQAVLSFHGAVLLEIERGLLQQGDSFLLLESRTLYGHLKATKPSASASSSANVPILFCRDYQRQTCTFEQDHYGLLRGERKWLRHICANCWVKGRTQALHPEGSKECPLSTNSWAKNQVHRAPSFILQIFLMKVLSTVIILFLRFLNMTFQVRDKNNFSMIVRDFMFLLLLMIQDFRVFRVSFREHVSALQVLR